MPGQLSSLSLKGIKSLNPLTVRYVKSNYVWKEHDPSQFNKPICIEDKVQIHFNQPQVMDNNPAFQLVYVYLKENHLDKSGKESLPIGNQLPIIEIITEQRLVEKDSVSKKYHAYKSKSTLGMYNFCSFLCFVKVVIGLLFK